MDKERLKNKENTNNPISKASAENESASEKCGIVPCSFFHKTTKTLRRIPDIFSGFGPFNLVVKGFRSLNSNGLKATFAKVKNHQKTKRIIAEIREIEKKTKAQIDTIQDLIKRCKALGGEVFGEEILLENIASDRVLLVSHELDLTGAPIALQYFAESLKRQGKLPVIIAPHDDKLRPLLTVENIPVITHPALYQSDFVPECAKLFSMIIINTIVGASIVSKLNGTDVPVLWWIHEAEVSYHPGAVAQMPEKLEANIHVYCAGEWAKAMLNKYKPGYSPGILLYCIPDLSKKQINSGFKLNDTEGKKIFLSVGRLEERKGQDVLTEAIRKLNDSERKKCIFVFVGKEYYQPIIESIKKLTKDYPDNVRYISELGRDDLHALYKQMDCLICSSKDDPMPVVVTEAMSLSKTVICSENTGSATLIEKYKAGMVYRNNEPSELAKCISAVFNAVKSDISDMVKNSGKLYEENFTTEVFGKNIQNIMSGILSNKEAEMSMLDGTVSVVIPTYNAGKELEPLLRCLNAQKGVGKVETVIVDSGSKDGTPEVARSFGAKVIEISQAEFSHSYARNLGIENAKGKYVMVMTQDAVPTGLYWLWSMAQPLVKDGVATVSCREIPKPNCDLFGRLGIYNHTAYMGIYNSDRILSAPNSNDFNDLRRNAQLNDVACMFNRKVFLEFKYRGSYAEDLDIGIRMVKAGYRLALLSSTQVIHSHNRSAYYYIKRGVVDVSNMKRILPEFPIHTFNSIDCMKRIVSFYLAQRIFVNDLLNNGVPEDKDGFDRWVNKEFERIRTNMRNMSRDDIISQLNAVTPYTDKQFHPLVKEFMDKCGENYAITLEGTYDAAYYLTTSVSPYMIHEYGRIDSDGREEIAVFMEKFSAQVAGNLLAGYVYSHSGEDSYMDEICEELSKGV